MAYDIECWSYFFQYEKLIRNINGFLKTEYFFTHLIFSLHLKYISLI